MVCLFLKEKGAKKGLLCCNTLLYYTLLSFYFILDVLLFVLWTYIGYHQGNPSFITCALYFALVFALGV